MNEYFAIEEVISRLRDEFDWTHSFIREFYFSTLRCFQKCQNDSGHILIGDADGPQNLRFVVAAAGNPTVSGIEFLCFDVSAFSLQRLDELLFCCQIENGKVKLSLSNASINNEDCWILSKEVHVAFLGKEYLGPSLRLGFELPSEDAIDASGIDECWRQCSNCSNAWIERPDVGYSRCPECGQLTKLQP